MALGEGIVRLFPTWHDTFLQDIVYSQLPTNLYKPVGGFQPGERPDKPRFKHHPNRQAQFKGREFDMCTPMRMAFGYLQRVDKIDKQIEILLLGDSFLFAGQVPWDRVLSVSWRPVFPMWIG